MPIRKFNITYGKQGAEATEVPTTKAEFKSLGKKMPSPKMRPMPERRKASLPADRPKDGQRQAKPNRTHQVAVYCVQEGIKDEKTIGQLVRQAYAGSGRPETYVEKAVRSALMFVRSHK